ncbi:MAG: hypothetical protein AB1489_15680 [Acidobacteriota bacterium]
MTELKLLLMLRHIRVIPKIFMLLERLGADCLDVQGELQPGMGGKLGLVVACPPTRAKRVKTQLERLVDVSEMHARTDEEIAHAQTYASKRASEYKAFWGGNGL